MPKSSIKQIKQDEEKILNELSKNAHKSINDIAKSLGFSRQKVWRVMTNLEENQTIWGYVAVKDVEKLGKKSFVILMKRTNKPLSEDIIDKVVKRDLLRRIKELEIDLINSYFTNGFYDWIICINAFNIKDVKKLVEEINKLYEGYIINIHLVEIIFTATSDGLSNPRMDEFKNFFKI